MKETKVWLNKQTHYTLLNTQSFLLVHVYNSFYNLLIFINSQFFNAIEHSGQAGFVLVPYFVNFSYNNYFR